MAMRGKILPTLIVVMLLAFTVRLVEVASGFASFDSSVYAMAEEKKEEGKKEEPKKDEEKKQDAKAADADPKKPVTDKAEAATKDPQKNEVQEWPDAGDAAMDMSTTKMEMVKDLVNRRNALDKRESELIAREALLKAAEKELDQKYQELSGLKADIETLLQQQSDAEKERTASLIKVYEGMKPKDAARIFDTLDLDILISVLSGMSPKKLSPILANMNEERARTVTIMLAEQKKLPILPLAN